MSIKNAGLLLGVFLFFAFLIFSGWMPLDVFYCALAGTLIPCGAVALGGWVSMKFDNNTKENNNA